MKPKKQMRLMSWAIKMLKDLIQVKICDEICQNQAFVIIWHIYKSSFKCKIFYSKIINFHAN